MSNISIFRGSQNNLCNGTIGSFNLAAQGGLAKKILNSDPSAHKKAVVSLLSDYYLFSHPDIK